MENIILKASVSTIKKSKPSKIQTRSKYLTAGIICFGGSLVFLIIGLLLPFIADFLQKTDKIFGYIGTIFLITSFLLFGSCAHFMDKAEESEKKAEKF